MARGWESKSVEAQMEEAESSSIAKPRLSAEEVETRQKLETLNLAKKKLQSDLQRATSERHRQMLTKSLEEIENQLRRLQ
jgi:hypothetical protein